MQQELQQRRHDAYHVDLFRRDPIKEAHRMELFVKHNAAAVVERRDERDHRAVDVVDRQDAHHSLVRRHFVPRGDLLGVNEQVAMREHHALGQPGRAGGVDDQGFVIRRDEWCGRLACLRTSRDGRTTIAADGHNSRTDLRGGQDRLDPRHERLADEGQLYARIGQDVADPPVVLAQIDRNDDRPDRPRGEVMHDRVGVVVSDRRDAVALADAGVSQETRRIAYSLIELPVRTLGSARTVRVKDQPGLVAVLLDLAAEQFAEAAVRNDLLLVFNGFLSHGQIPIIIHPQNQLSAIPKASPMTTAATLPAELLASLE